MVKIQYYLQESIPLEMHKVRIIQKLNLLPIESRLEELTYGGYNTFLLRNRHVFLDMLTDSGVNAMSDRQQAAMLTADDAYAGSETFYRLEAKLTELFGTKYFLPTHQGRAAENILSRTFINPGDTVLMNYHFTTSRSHVVVNGGLVEELISDAGVQEESTLAFKGDMDLDKLRAAITRLGPEKIAFVRMEAGTNLIGGQPVSMQNMRDVTAICRQFGIMSVLDASLLADNLYFIKVREAEYADTPIAKITAEMMGLYDLIYFSARKLGFARGGGIITNREDLYEAMKEWIPLYEGFMTYGGMSVREMEAITIGLDETMEEDMISQGPLFIAHMADELTKRGIPIITPAGGLGCHLNAMKVLDHIPREEYRAGALAAAVYLCSGVRGMERGTISEDRNPDGSDHLADMELLRLALPRRVFTMSQVKYAVDRIAWLYDHRHLIGGLRFVQEPRVLRFFLGRLEPTSDWPQQLIEKFRQDFGDSL
ncbi:MAG: tryptophanase [Propionibacteriaceae bacterium]|jgi:tryptophanase|nr:tryptophanase [Propionibacteriaceae bacterium]